MSEATAILKALKQQQSAQKFSIGELFNVVHPEWNGEADVLRKFKSDVEDLDGGGLIIVTRTPNVETEVRMANPGDIVANRFK
jgi:hypothetical protein